MAPLNHRPRFGCAAVTAGYARKAEMREELEKLVAEYTGPTITRRADNEELLVRRMREQARIDMQAYRQARAAQDGRIELEPMSHETMRVAAELKRVRRVRHNGRSSSNQ
jgi:hypothetical protein